MDLKPFLQLYDDNDAHPEVPFTTHPTLSRINLHETEITDEHWFPRHWRKDELGAPT